MRKTNWHRLWAIAGAAFIVTYGVIAGIALALEFIGPRISNTDDTVTLPHRAPDELTNWGQGRQPPTNDCPPGTVRMEAGGVFLECFRGTN